MDDLSRIERQYGSVAEYSRCMDEDSGRRWEQREKAEKYYAENRQQVERHRQAGHRQMAEAFCAEERCFSCKSRTQTFTCDEGDDIGTFFCLDENCPFK